MHYKKNIFTKKRDEWKILKLYQNYFIFISNFYKRFLKNICLLCDLKLISGNIVVFFFVSKFKLIYKIQALKTIKSQMKKTNENIKTNSTSTLPDKQANSIKKPLIACKSKSLRMHGQQVFKKINVLSKNELESDVDKYMKSKRVLLEFV
ncbi:hypothetical protein RFI_33835 [Reticulomyxa filosa]|uniref:Uncharacterized protein n=1 Tax=Reticulomyxa filosa TaxID=46433 RepID=X6LQZ3_RETFI|nr:hypothetical protein RFI_33835 [Reticulomyxa filosa]|eukprot:ETO03567.1 hypothetical protein RFI_33835 [Reticulomyxa filosa]